LAASLAAAPSASGQSGEYSFSTSRTGEAVADLTLSSPGAAWGRPGREAAMADVRVDGGPAFQVMLYAGELLRTYPVFLGKLSAGPHKLTIAKNETYSAPGTSVAVKNVSVRGAVDDPVLAHAPVLYARKNTIGKFTDVPLVVYAERLPEGSAGTIQYTVIFSNEDGGTSTRGLMARWGRTTDIEYVYRLDVATGKAIIQTRDHKDVEFTGRHEDGHPLLIPVTDNNMVAGEVPSAIRYQIAPRPVDLGADSRELVMYQDPLLYRVASEELEREGKLRPFGVVDGQKISDPRNYLYVEAKIEVRGAGVVTLVQRKGDPVWHSSAIGRYDYGVDRDGWIQTAVELPPGTKPRDIGAIGFTCEQVPDSNTKRLRDTGSCRVLAVKKVFFLDSDYRPLPSIWSVNEAAELPAGIIRTYSVQ
jgi:hypothetical protein